MLARTHQNREYKTNPTSATEKQKSQKNLGESIPHSRPRLGGYCRIPENGVPQAKIKNCLDPKNRTNGMNKQGLDRNLRFARDPVAEPQRKQTILRLARDRLAEAPTSRPPRWGPLAWGLGRSADSPIRARPARHQPRGRLFNQTALTERRIQAPNHSDRRTMAQYSEVTDYTPVASTSCHLRRHRAGVTDHCAA